MSYCLHIPKKIHQIWFQGENNLPEKYKSYQNTWKKHHRDWEYILWDDESMRGLLMEKYPELLPTYRNSPYMHQKIDFFKYVLMYDQGGMYTDMDTKSIKCVEGLIKKFPHSKVLLSSGFGSEMEHMVLVGDKMINNGIFMSCPRHPIFKKLIREMQNNTVCKYLNKMGCISYTTGPRNFTRICREYLKNSNDQSVNILDNKYLEPCFSFDYNCKVSKNAYANHIHSQTWIPEPIKPLITLYYILKNNMIITLPVFMILVYLLLKRFKYV